MPVARAPAPAAHPVPAIAALAGGRASTASAPAAANDATATPAARSLLRFITCGSVDDGKSTLIGRLLYEAGAVYEDQLAALDRDSARFGTTGGRDYALLVDGLAAEREQGITIDVAYRYFSTPRRAFIVADTPGHEQYTRNMATGASTADLAIILVDAGRGLLPQTRRHALIASLLGVRHAVLAVNKMDTVGYDEARFSAIRIAFAALAADLRFDTVTAIPVSAREGAGIAAPSPAMPWYHGPTLLQALETAAVEVPGSEPGRFAVQLASRPSADFRGYAGLMVSGSLSVGDAVRVLPSGRASNVARVLLPAGEADTAMAGQTPTLCLADAVDVSRGDVIVAAGDPIRPRRRLVARLIWTGERPLVVGDTCAIKLGSLEAQATLEALHHRVDITSFQRSAATTLESNGIGLVTISLDRPAVLTDYVSNRTLGGFILIDRVSRETSAFGLVDLAADTGAGSNKSPRTGVARLFGRLRRWAASGGEQPRRSLAKAVTWRITGSLDTFLLSWLFTRSAGVAAAISVTEIITKLALYYGHERLWARSRYGLPGRREQAENTQGAGI
jgi:sulfate adenylyltransferase large subunit